MKIVTITPHRKRLPQLKNHLRSIAWQERKPDHVIVSCHGDTEDTRREAEDLMFEYLGAQDISMQMWAIGEPEDDWCKPLAINWAIRRTDEDVDIIATLDVDCILHPLTMTRLEEAIEEKLDRYVMCPNLSLGKACEYPPDWTYDDLREQSRHLSWLGAREGRGPISMSWGCLQAARRDWWFGVRGLDEEMKLWGSEDHDMAKRATGTGLTRHWLPRKISLLHQWHRAGQLDYKRDPRILAWLKKNYQTSLNNLWKKNYVRNPDGWGGMD